MNNNQNSKSNFPIDLNSALQRVGGDRAFLKELLDIYLEDFTERYNQLEKSIEKNNFDNIQNIGHSLKGASANLSLIKLQEVSYKLETAGKEKDRKKAQENLNQLKIEFNALKKFLSENKI